MLLNLLIPFVLTVGSGSKGKKQLIVMWLQFETKMLRDGFDVRLNHPCYDSQLHQLSSLQP